MKETFVRPRTPWDRAVELMHDVTDGTAEEGALAELTVIASQFHLESRTVADGLERELLDFAKKRSLADVTEKLYERFRYGHSLELSQDPARLLFIRWFAAREKVS